MDVENNVFIVSFRLNLIWLTRFHSDPNGAEESDDIPADDDWLLFDQDNQNVYLLKDTTVDNAETYIWNRANYCAFWSEYVPFLNTQTGEWYCIQILFTVNRRKKKRKRNNENEKIPLIFVCLNKIII